MLHMITQMLAALAIGIITIAFILLIIEIAWNYIERQDESERED